MSAQEDFEFVINEYAEGSSDKAHGLERCSNLLRELGGAGHFDQILQRRTDYQNLLRHTDDPAVVDLQLRAIDGADHSGSEGIGGGQH